MSDDDAAMAAMGLPTAFRDRVTREDDALPDALHTIAITQELVGAKLAKLIATTVDGWSRNAAAAAAREGNVRVNGERSGANRVLQSGDAITVHAAPPSAYGESAETAAEETLSACPLTACQINYLVDERVRAKASADYALADKLFAELVRAGVRMDDRTKTWTSMSTGMSGTQIVLSPEELVVLRAAKQTADAAKPQDPDMLAAHEAKRRRLKNAKKREAKARKLAAAEGAVEPLPVETPSEGGMDGWTSVHEVTDT
mmetsp:Transcript_851/g.1409  ORF Transcript_851/g.1409 Transcript_851/m.1409 type:complete len:258 (+) Transcript_851:118-891(+)